MTVRRVIPPALAIAGASLIVVGYVRGTEPSHLGAIGLVLLALGIGFMPRRTKP